jgi:hypothetical protein
VVENAQHPAAACFAIRAIRQHGRILQRNIDLIIEAIGDPAANLFAGATAAIHLHIERMMDVIRGAFRAQLCFEFFAGPGRALVASVRLRVLARRRAQGIFRVHAVSVLHFMTTLAD